MAGGEGLRLGRVKALEQLGKRRLIERVVNSLYPISQEIFVVTSQEQFTNVNSAGLNARLVVDLFPGKAALGGIYTGLKSANTFYSLIVACDMPFLNRTLLSYLINLAPGFDAVVPEIDNKVESLHTVYSKNCLPYINQLLVEDNLAVSELFNLVETRYVNKDEIAQFDPEYLSFFNINTKSDLIAAETLIEHRENCD